MQEHHIYHFRSLDSINQCKNKLNSNCIVNSVEERLKEEMREAMLCEGFHEETWKKLPSWYYRYLPGAEKCSVCLEGLDGGMKTVNYLPPYEAEEYGGVCKKHRNANRLKQEYNRHGQG